MAKSLNLSMPLLQEVKIYKMDIMISIVSVSQILYSWSGLMYIKMIINPVLK
jgi:hypothetical protein